MKTAKKLFVGYESACAYWALPRSRTFSGKRAYGVRNLRSATANIGTVRAARLGEPWLAELPGPLHVVVPAASAVRVSNEVVCHVVTRDLPAGSFVGVGDSVFVASPELCAVQAATWMEPLALIRYLSMLSAGFVIDEASDEIISCEPLTSLDAVARYADRLPPRTPGVQRLRGALSHGVERAASPPEIATALLLSMPMRLGGYGLPKPVLNQRVDVRGAAMHVSQKSFYVLDLYWPGHSVGLEYDSTAYHTQEERIAEDAKRRVAVAALGIELITLTRPQLYSSDAFNQVAHLLASKMGRRLRFRGKGFARARIALREALL